jgi:hypothetical protein
LAVFRKIREFFSDNSNIEIHGGSKGGFSYLLFYDRTQQEVIGHYVTPPVKTSRNLQGKVNVPLIDTQFEVNYQSEVSLGAPFVVMNSNRRSSLTEQNLISKVNEGNLESSIKPPEVYNLESTKSYVAGQYVVPVSTNNIEAISFQSHFKELNMNMKNSLDIFLDFILKNFWHDQQIYRASIFLYDAQNKELSMMIERNVSPYSDYNLSFKKSNWRVWECYEQKTQIISDFEIRPREDFSDRELMSKIWKDMQSLIAIPILDSSNTAFGVVCVDTDKDYITAKFKEKQHLLMMLTNGIGKLLEGNLV